MVCTFVRGRGQGRDAGANRSGFTLVELLLVLTVVATILAVAWPNVLRLTSQQKLIDSAEKVRAVAASARMHAIDSGLAYQFRYEPGGRHFVMVPFEREFEGVSPNARGTGTALGRFSKASGMLPDGVTFTAPSLGSTAAVNPAAATGQQISSLALTGLPDAGKLESVTWSGPVLFQPDGSSTDAMLDLIDRRHQRVTLKIRGITGATSASRVHQERR